MTRLSIVVICADKNMNFARLARPNHWVCKICTAKGGSLPLLTQRRWQSASSSSSGTFLRQWSTPLAKTIGEAIQTTGPISLAQYMRLCLTSPEDGYYTRQAKDGDQFGQKGDFVTSPEISQVFGELLGLWFVTEWIAQGRKKDGLELIEVGPGRGTLMDDMLRAIRNFKAFAGGIESVYLIEASPALREKQKRLLCDDQNGIPAPMEETDIGWRSRSKYGGIPVTWCEDIRLVSKKPNKTPFIVAHEFFDALPIHAFRTVAPAAGEQGQTTVVGLDGKPIAWTQNTTAKKTNQWRELLVSLADVKPELAAKNRSTSKLSAANPPDFKLVQAPASNPTSLVIPETSPRYRALKSMTDAVVEISPESHTYAGEFAVRIGGGKERKGVPKSQTSTPPTSSQSPTASHRAPSGAALILDYGTLDTVPTSTLRGIRSHELVSPFMTPGLTDLSADVDFTALAEAAINASPGVEVHGPVEQGAFLESMGIRERAAALEKAARAGGDTKGEATAKRVRSAVERLVERGGGSMGKIYKAMAIIPENGGRRRPVGFGGQVV